MSTGDAARIMGAGKRHVSRTRRRYADAGRVPGHGKPGRRKKRIPRSVVRIVPGAHAEHMCGTMRLERIPGARGIHVPHNTTRATLERRGLARRDRPEQRRSFVGYGRTFPDSMWHSDWKRLKDGRCLIAHGDDAFRPIAGYWVSGRATPANAVRVLRQATREHGKPAFIIADHDPSPTRWTPRRAGRRHGVRGVPGGQRHTPRPGARQAPADHRQDRAVLRDIYTFEHKPAS